VYPERIKLSDKEFSKKLDYSGVSYPVKIKDVGKIEKQNCINVNIFGYVDGSLYPIRISKNMSIICKYYILQVKNS